MNLTTSFCFFKLLALLALPSLISACGGSTGFAPTVTGVSVQSAQYGKTATIFIGGKDLRSQLLVDTNDACTNPSFASNSTTDTLVLNCIVSKVGDFDLVVKTADGQAIYTTTLSVAVPQVALFTSKGSITVELDPNAAPTSVNNFLNYVNTVSYTHLTLPTKRIV